MQETTDIFMNAKSLPHKVHKIIKGRIPTINRHRILSPYITSDIVKNSIKRGLN